MFGLGPSVSWVRSDTEDSSEEDGGDLVSGRTRTWVPLTSLDVGPLPSTS